MSESSGSGSKCNVFYIFCFTAYLHMQADLCISYSPNIHIVFHVCKAWFKLVYICISTLCALYHKATPPRLVPRVCQVAHNLQPIRFLLLGLLLRELQPPAWRVMPPTCTRTRNITEPINSVQLLGIDLIDALLSQRNQISNCALFIRPVGNYLLLAPGSFFISRLLCLFSQAAKVQACQCPWFTFESLQRAC